MALLSGTVGLLSEDLTTGVITATLIFECNGLGFKDKYPGTSYAVTSMFFCNLSSDSINLTVYLVPNGDEPTGSNTIIKTLPINGLDTFAFDTEKIILDNGDSIYAAATRAGDISVVASIVRVA